jgi:hypothetical protein
MQGKSCELPSTRRRSVLVVRAAKYSEAGYLVVQTIKYSDCQSYTPCLMIAALWALVQGLINMLLVSHQKMKSQMTRIVTAPRH